MAASSGFQYGTSGDESFGDAPARNSERTLSQAIRLAQQPGTQSIRIQVEELITRFGHGG